jgi:heme exporter protein C
MNALLKAWYRLGTPHFFYAIAQQWQKPLAFITLILLLVAGYWGFWLAPADYQQGEAFRIIYVHVPAAWLSMLVYVVMTVAAVMVMVWRVRMAEVALMGSAAIGAIFTLIALITGAIWGKPTWGTWWVWDARLTSELILFFIYMGIISLYHAIDDKRSAGRAVSILTLVGVVNLPIIHYSVVWWNTLHQAASVSKLDAPSIHIEMLLPLLMMTVAFKLLYLWILLIRMQGILLIQDAGSGWVNAYFHNQQKEAKT